MPKELQPKPVEGGRKLGWVDILGAWPVVVADLSAVYGIHFETTDLPWPGLRDRIIALVSLEQSQLRGALLA